MWINKWPVEAGWYWFYGRCSRWDQRAHLEAVHVRLCADLRPVYVVGGRFMHQSEGGIGYWQPLETPMVPLPIAGGQ